MEAYSGLAILATNMRSALDIAFTRRLRFIVNFPFPNAADRKLMWQKAFPRETPRGALDYEKLARLNLTGGGISNAAINAAFLAAQLGMAVSMGAALTAARQEMIKLNRPINEADFRWQETGEVVA
jgi:SpoVK/Ycf46/Vps4 family AAA+-type ATPase